MKRKPAKYADFTIEDLLTAHRRSIALQYVPEAMKTEALCLAAVEQKEKGRILRYIFDKHMDDPNDFEA